jgi:hypothetical protein
MSVVPPPPKIGMNGESVGLDFLVELVEGVIGRDAYDLCEVQMFEEYFAVVYHGNTHREGGFCVLLDG